MEDIIEMKIRLYLSTTKGTYEREFSSLEDLTDFLIEVEVEDEWEEVTVNEDAEEDGPLKFVSPLVANPELLQLKRLMEKEH